MSVILSGNDKYKDFLSDLKVKIRDDIASIIPESVIEEMAREVINEEFFKKKTKNIYGHEKTEPSEFANHIIETAKPMIKEYAEKYFKDNILVFEDKIKECFNEYFDSSLVVFFKKVAIEAIKENSYEIGQIISNNQ